MLRETWKFGIKLQLDARSQERKTFQQPFYVRIRALKAAKIELLDDKGVSVERIAKCNLVFEVFPMF